MSIKAILAEQQKSYTKAEEDALLAQKQDTITVLSVANGGTGNSSVDTAPTANSSKMVTSGGVYDALATKQDSLTIDTSTLLNDSTHVPASSMVKSALMSKVKKVLIIGDSYLDRTPSYGSYLADMVEDITVILKGEAGAGFHHLSTLGGRTFEWILTNYANTLTSVEKESFTDIIVIGGSNDRDQTEANVRSAMDSFFSAAQIAFPCARLHCGFLGWTWLSATQESSIDKLKFIKTQEIYKDETHQKNICWIENLQYNMKDYAHYADAGHPDNVISKRVGEFLYRYLMTGHADVHFSTTVSFTLGPKLSIGTFDSNIEYISCDVVNGITIFKAYGETSSGPQVHGRICLTASGITFNGELLTLANLSGGSVFGVENKPNCEPSLNSITLFVNDGGTLKVVPSMVGVINGTLYLACYNGVVADWSNVTKLILGPIEIVIPTDYA